MTGAPGADQSLTLAIGFGPPELSRVAVTEDPAYPVSNTLRLSIMNPSYQPLVAFRNPNGLTPDDPLPPASAPTSAANLDRLYVFFPWGSGSGQLTTEEQAATITCSPGPDNDSWYTRVMSSPELGTYWILFPKKEGVLDPNESVLFVLAGITTSNPAPSQTVCYVQHRVQGYEDGTDNTSVFLEDPAPAIASFTSDQDNVDPGTRVKLSWQARGALSCTLDPGGQRFDGPGGSTTVVVDESTTFQLTATNRAGSTPATLPVAVLPVAVQAFEADPGTGVRVGDPVTLKWTVAHALSCVISGLGDVGKESGERAVKPLAPTTYTLTARGQGGPKTASVFVLPLPVGWSQPTRQTPWNTLIQPVLVTLDDTLYLMTGGDAGWVYSSRDGADWQAVTTDAPWPNRMGARGTVHAGRMWVLGGRWGNTFLNDVWSSSDGVSWTQATAGAAWSPRARFGCVSFAGRLWVLGGQDAQGGLGDVWSSDDGVKWTEAHRPAWSARSDMGAAVSDAGIWIVGGSAAGAPVADIWFSSDGQAWSRKPAPPWPPRSGPLVQSLRGGLYVSGGTGADGHALDDLYVMGPNGSWGLRDGPGWNGLEEATSTAYQDALWIAGGTFQSAGGGGNTVIWLFAPPAAGG